MPWPLCRFHLLLVAQHEIRPLSPLVNDVTGVAVEPPTNVNAKGETVSSPRARWISPPPPWASRSSFRGRDVRSATDAPTRPSLFPSWRFLTWSRPHGQVPPCADCVTYTAASDGFFSARNYLEHRIVRVASHRQNLLLVIVNLVVRRVKGNAFSLSVPQGFFCGGHSCDVFTQDVSATTPVCRPSSQSIGGSFRREREQAKAFTAGIHCALGASLMKQFHQAA